MSLFMRAAFGVVLAGIAAPAALLGADWAFGGDDADAPHGDPPATTQPGEQDSTSTDTEADTVAGTGPDPVRAAIRAFAGELEGAPSPYPGVDALLAACATPTSRAAAPSGEPFLLGARYDPDARYDDMVYEGLAGVPEPMLFVTLGFVHGEANSGSIRRYTLPLDWASLTYGDGAVSPAFGFAAIALRVWTIDPAGALGPSQGVDVYDTVSMPCADPQAGAAALETLRDAMGR